MNNEELNHYKKYNIHPEIIKAIENLKPVVRDKKTQSFDWVFLLN
jgi:hypothetical protein